jgi:hypothetical protein
MGGGYSQKDIVPGEKGLDGCDSIFSRLGILSMADIAILRMPGGDWY